MHTVLQAAADNENFFKQGYARVPLLNADEIARLLAVFQAYAQNYSQPFHTSHFSTDKSYKQQVNDAISDVLRPHINSVLNNYIPVFGNWMVKNGDGNNAMPLHADWTYVNESKYRSVAFWIPLIDTDGLNGCFSLIPGSQQFTPDIRGPRIMQGNWQNYERWIKEAGKQIPMKAGEAIIYDHGLLHFSPPNVSGKIRPALNLSCVPAEAELFHYCIPEGTDSIRKYKVEELSFFTHYDNFAIPEKGTPVEYINALRVVAMDVAMENYVNGFDKRPVES